MPRRLDPPRQRDRAIDAGDAGPALADVELDDDRERLAGFLAGGGKRVHIRGIVRDHHEPLGLLVQGDEPVDHRRRHDRRGDQHAFYSGARDHLRLADGRAADADGARGHLPAADLDRFGALAVRPQIDAGRFGMRGHGGDIGVERVEVEQQRRRIEAGARALLADEFLIRPKAAGFRFDHRHLPVSLSPQAAAR